MQDDYKVIYNNKTNYDLGILVANRPDIPSPEKKLEKISLDGRDGDLYIDFNVYSDIVIAIEFNFLNDNNFEVMRNVRKWLLGSINKKLYFTDDTTFFYKVKKVSIDDNNRLLESIGNFTANFTCDPYMYIADGDIERKIGNSIYNTYDMCKPRYRIDGEGVCYFTVNDTTVRVNVGQSIIIDTELALCYKNDTISNISMSGDYEGLYLKSGQNNINVQEGFTLYAMPRWRRL